jgi:putative oxidoreductase
MPSKLGFAVRRNTREDWMSPGTIDVLLLIGRILYGGFFLISGMNHFTRISSYKQYVGSKGIPAPSLAVVGSGLLIFLGGLSVLLGLWPYVGLLLIAIFLVGTTPTMHAFWKVSEPMAKMADQINFMKNLALLGAALAMVAIPQPWPLALGH